MKRFLGLVRYEYAMSTRRWSMWLGYGLLYIFYGAMILTDAERIDAALNTVPALWSEVGHVVFAANMFACLLGGIIAADRLYRDKRLGLAELQQSTPLRCGTYLAAKYLGTVVSVLTPALILVLGLSGAEIILGASPVVIPMTLAAFLAVMVPSYLFVTAFSLACPLFMPLRVYQVLFTGYWFWGNYLSPQAFPTISDTLLNAGGTYAVQGFFDYSFSGSETSLYTPTQAVLNIAVLMGCALAVLILLERYYACQARKA